MALPGSVHLSMRVPLFFPYSELSAIGHTYYINTSPTYLSLPCLTISWRGTEWVSPWDTGLDSAPSASSAVLRNPGLSVRPVAFTDTCSVTYPCPLWAPSLLGATTPESDHLTIMWHCNEAFRVRGPLFSIHPYFTSL